MMRKEKQEYYRREKKEDHSPIIERDLLEDIEKGRYIVCLQPEFDIQTWIDYAKAYAESVGLRPESSAVDCWDTPIDADADCIYLERDICSRLNRYAADETITDIWVWCEAVGTNSYLLYIGYA